MNSEEGVSLKEIPSVVTEPDHDIFEFRNLKILKKESRPTANDLDDEFQNQNKTILSPLKSVNIEIKDTVTFGQPDKKVLKNFDDEIKNELSYYSCTGGLETETERTAFLQGIANKLLSVNGPQTRIVILNKGDTPNAFVIPDGTIFISQSLINKLDTIDEIAAVIAHEIGHLENKTFEKKVQTSGQCSLGVGWVHEMAADLTSAAKLERAGFNSLAFARAIVKLSGNDRGSVHQTGDSRASQSVGSHLAIDYATSSISETPKPDILNRAQRKTNVEIVSFLVSDPKNEDYQQLPDMLIKLHPRDFREVLRKIKNTFYKNDATEDRLIDICNGYVIARLLDAGYQEPEALIFLLANDEHNRYLFDKPETMVMVTDALPQFVQSKKFDAINKYIFDSNIPKPVVLPLLNEIQSLLIPSSDTTEKDDIPISQDTLLDALQRISKTDFNYRTEQFILENKITDVLFVFLEKSYIRMGNLAREPLDPEQIRSFWQEVKSRNIPINKNLTYDYWINRRYRTDAPEKTELDKLEGNNRKLLTDIYREVFDLKASESIEVAIDESFIDRFFGSDVFKVSKESTDYEFLSDIKKFTSELRDHCTSAKFTDAQRLAYLNRINHHLKNISLPSWVDIEQHLRTSTLENYNYYDLINRNKEENSSQIDRLRRLNMQIYFALNLFPEDSDEFYSYLENAMQESLPDFSTKSRMEQINISQALLSLNINSEINIPYIFYTAKTISSEYLANGTKIQNYQRFLNLPFIKTIMESSHDMQFSTIGELNEFLEIFTNNPYFIGTFWNHLKSIPLFEDTMVSLVLGKGIRKNVVDILQHGVDLSQLPQLVTFVERYYPDGIQKNHFLREINKRYLLSSDVSIEDKTEYLINNFDRVGPEGMIIIAQLIDDIDVYRSFRIKMGKRIEEYLNGDKIITSLAIGDFLSSFVTGHYELLFRTARVDSRSKSKQSTSFAKRWFNYYMSTSNKYSHPGCSYDSVSGKFIVNSEQRQLFKTISDAISSLKELTPLQRFAIVHKSLVDSHGALSTPKDRKKLASILKSTLGFKQGFVAETLNAAAMVGDAKIIGFPASNMFSPMLFQSLDVQSVDFGKLLAEKVRVEVQSKEDSHLMIGKDKKLKDVLSPEQIQYFLNATTRDVILFGSDYRDFQDSAIAKLAQDSDAEFAQITQILTQTFSENGNNGNKKNGELPTVDPNVESVIRGVEASGALGARSLQLTTQFYHGSPELEARLSQSFDANPGLNKLLFWENLSKLGQSDPQIESFIQNLELGSYLGGGSLYTTYTGKLKDTNEEVVVKMLNPNTIAFLGEGYKLGSDTLDVVAKKGGASERRYANMGRMLIDLSHQWCLADINDPYFEEDDDRFRDIVRDFNATRSLDIVYAPERRFTSFKLKSETLGMGQTINQLLKDPNTSDDAKRESVRLLAQFFKHQLKGKTFQSAEGDEFILFHSDPHIGNYIVEMEGDQVKKMGALDRNMYLRLKKEDVALIKKLLEDTNYNDFVYSFIDRILDVNKINGRIDRLRITSSVLTGVAKEFIAQRIRGNIDKFSLLRELFTGVSHYNLEIPLELRLMIRNVGALQELSQKCGLSLEEI